MKALKVTVCLALAAALAVVPLVGCSGSNSSAALEGDFTFSSGIDDKGYWEGVKALDHVELGQYEAMEIPYSSHSVSDESLQSSIDSLVSQYSTTAEVTDRAVVNGDTLNIDYVGSVDGVEFSGGSTQGKGTEVTVGTTSYVDDFIEQLIGHMPGETFNIEVTFPDDYSNAEVSGKDAIFTTTINYISDTVEPEVNDAFVAEKFSESKGWNTVEDMRAAERASLEKQTALSYVSSQVVQDATVKSIPEIVSKYQEKALVYSAETYASQYGVEVNEYLSQQAGVESIEELLEQSADSNKQRAEQSLVYQALAEKMGITANEEDVKNYFVEYMGTDDYSAYEKQYGMNYLKQVVMTEKVLNQIVDNAVLLPAGESTGTTDAEGANASE